MKSLSIILLVAGSSALHLTASPELHYPVPLIDGYGPLNYGGPLAYGRDADDQTKREALDKWVKDLNTPLPMNDAEKAREKDRAAAAGWEGREKWNEDVKSDAKGYADKQAKELVKSLNSPLTWW